MLNTKDLRSIYETAIAPELEKVESQRLSARNGLVVALGGCGVVLWGSWWLLTTKGLGLWMFLPWVIIVLIFSAWYANVYRPYQQQFKERVIRSLLAKIAPGLAYKPNDHVPKPLFIDSGLFPLRADYYGGDDRVHGRLGDTEFLLSELNVQHVERSRRSVKRRGQVRKAGRHAVPVFRGLFFVADFPKTFTGSTIILPDTAERWLGQAGQGLQELRAGGRELIRLEDPEFEKHFVVYGDDQVESRYVLSTSLMARLSAFRNKTGADLYVAFNDSRVYMAIALKRPLLEPTLFRTLKDFSLIEGYWEDLLLGLGIVEDLNLNTRIWSKKAPQHNIHSEEEVQPPDEGQEGLIPGLKGIPAALSVFGKLPTEVQYELADEVSSTPFHTWDPVVAFPKRGLANEQVAAGFAYKMSELFGTKVRVVTRVVSGLWGLVMFVATGIGIVQGDFGYWTAGFGAISVILLGRLLFFLPVFMRRVTVCLGLLGLAGWGVLAAHLLRQGIVESQTWPQVEAKVLTASLTETQNVDRGSSRIGLNWTSYGFDLSYSYDYEGTTYTCDDVALGKFSHKKALLQFSVGGTYPAQVNPDNPQQAILMETRVPEYPFGPSATLVAISFLWMARAWRGHSAR